MARNILFYISAGIALLWSSIFLVFGCDSPRNSNNISKTERNYIEASTGAEQNEDVDVPWRSIFTSLPFFASIAAHCGFTWGFCTLLTEVSTFLNCALNLDMKSNALLFALPYFVMCTLCLILSSIADLLIRHHITTVTVSRKLFNSVGQWIPMIALSYIYQTAITSERFIHPERSSLMPKFSWEILDTLPFDILCLFLPYYSVCTYL